MVLGLAAGVPAVGLAVPGGVGAAVIAADNSDPQQDEGQLLCRSRPAREAAIKRLRKMSDPTSSSYRQFPRAQEGGQQVRREHEDHRLRAPV